MKIENLLDMENLERRIAEGLIRARVHPDHPTLLTLGYTEKAQWDRVWDNETLTCRGLIYETETGEVLARPYRKFFNHSEYGQDHLRAELDLSAPVEVTDKMDGSLGIIYRNPFTDELAVATRGSFDSDQARLANDQFLPAILDHGYEPTPGWTYLTEIIHPSNRIVLDYKDKQGLALLGAVHIETGDIVGPGFDSEWPDHRAEVFDAESLGGALAMEPRPNAEGLVVRYLFEKDTMVKIKQEDYVRLHQIISGLSDKAVWEHMSGNGGSIEGMVAAVPDEFHEWLTKTAAGFYGAFAGITDRALDDFERIVDQLDSGPEEEPAFSRRAFAELAKKNERPHLMFALLDGRDISEMIWKELRPVGVRYMSENVQES